MKLDGMPVFYVIVSMIMYLCVFSIIFSVIMNFIMVRIKNDSIKYNGICPVEALTMTIFCTGVFLLVKFRIGLIELDDGFVNRSIIVIGLAFLITGAVSNIIARINLGTNWSNSMKIYENQKIITNGMYSIVRHPLFFSLILVLTGTSIIYKNYASLSATYLIFVPAMAYRAKKEEEVLVKEFPEYIEYAERVPMLFPFKFKRRKA